MVPPGMARRTGIKSGAPAILMFAGRHPMPGDIGTRKAAPLPQKLTLSRQSPGSSRHVPPL